MAEEFEKLVTPAREREIERQEGQVDLGENVQLGFRQTALHAGIRKIEDEAGGNLQRNIAEDKTLTGIALDNLPTEGSGPVINAVKNKVLETTIEVDNAVAGFQSLLGRTGEGVDPDYNKMDHIDDLLDGIPRRYHNDIMANTSLEAADRARARVLLDLKDQEIIALQDFGGVTRFSSSLLDADLPLVFASGGAFGAAKISAGTVKVAAAARIGAKGQRVLGATAAGASGGAQSGALVGLASLQWREGSGVSDVVNYTVMGTLGGAVLLGAGKGLSEVGASFKKTADDYADRLVDGDPTLQSDPYIPDGDAAPAAVRIGGSDGFVQEGAQFSQGQTVRFTGVGSEGTELPRGLEPVDFSGALEDISPEHQKLVNDAHRANYESDFYNQKDKDADKLIQKLSNSKWATATGTGSQGKWYNSASPLLNHVGQTFFENGSGYLRGKNTSGILDAKYTSRIQTQLEGVRHAALDYAKSTGDTIAFNQGINNAGLTKFNRAVMIERNRRAFGRQGTDDANVRLGADSYDNAAREALAIGKGRDGETAIDGFADLPDNPHYTRTVWGNKAGRLIKDAADPKATQTAIVKGLAQSYRDAGMAAGKDAEAVARAVISRSVNNEKGIDTSLVGLLQGDGRDVLRDALVQEGMSEALVEGLMKRLVGDLSERSKDGFAKSKNDLDLETVIDLPDGQQVQIVDLISNDLQGDWQRYGRQLAGSAALARNGITNGAERSAYIDAILTEQRRLGEDAFTKGELEALFSAFDGGALKGHHWGMGDVAQEQGAIVANAKRAVNLAYLGKLGLTQLGETGGTIVQVGLQNWAHRGVISNLNKELKAGNKRVLAELAVLTGNAGKDEHHLAAHLQLDEMNAIDTATLAGKLQKFSNDASYVQGYISFFNQVRSWQQKTAALGIMDSIMREVQKDLANGGLSEKNLLRLWGDFGLDAADITRLGALVEDGTVKFKTTGNHTFVDELGLDNWDPDLAETFSSAVVRNTNAVVQRALAGEQDAWMSTQAGSVFTHLKTFPMQATQKQFVRHFRHNDGKAYAAVGYSFATAYVASMVRAGLDGKDMDTKAHAKRAFSYSNMTGFIPMAYDPLMTVLGMEDKRFSQFSPHSDITPPALSFANDALRLPGALGKAALGKADGSDRQAVRTLPFSNTILYGEMINGIASRNRE